MAEEQEQLCLGDILDAVGTKDVSRLPEGASNLSRKELVFITNYLKTGNGKESALAAGFSGTSESLCVQASKLLRKPNVYAFYQKCMTAMAKNADEILRRTWERSRLFHDKLLECAQERGELEDELLLASKSEDTETSKSYINKKVKEYETRLSKMLRLEKHYSTLVHREDALLATLLGKLNVNVNVNETHSLEVAVIQGKPLTAEALAQLAQARRQELRDSLGGGRN